MIEAWAKRAFVCGTLAALAHSAAWAGYVYHLQRKSYEALEQRQGVIEAIRFSRTGSSGMLTRMPTLVVTVRPLGQPQAPLQEVSTAAPQEMAVAYFERHREGDLVPIWVYRRSGHIDDVMAPTPPDAMRYFLITLATLGLFTFFLVFAICGHLSHSPAAKKLRRRR